MQKFANGDRVRWTEGDEERAGVVTESDVKAPSEADDDASTRFHRVTMADGTSHVIAETELDPTDSSTEN